MIQLVKARHNKYFGTTSFTARIPYLFKILFYLKLWTASISAPPTSGVSIVIENVSHFTCMYICFMFMCRCNMHVIVCILFSFSMDLGLRHIGAFICLMSFVTVSWSYEQISSSYFPTFFICNAIDDFNFKSFYQSLL